MAEIPDRSAKPPAPHPAKLAPPALAWLAVVIASVAGVTLGPVPLGMAIALAGLASFLAAFWAFKVILDVRRHRIDDFETTLGTLDMPLVRIPDDEPARWPIARPATATGLLGRDAWTLWRAQGLGDGLRITIAECVLPTQRDHEGEKISPKLFCIAASVPCPEEWPEFRVWSRGIRLTFLHACTEWDQRVGDEPFDTRWQLGRPRPDGRLVAQNDAQNDAQSGGEPDATDAGAADLAALVLTPSVQGHLMETDAHELWQFGAGAITCLRAETVTDPRLVLPIQRVLGLIERLDPTLIESIRTPAPDA